MIKIQDMKTNQIMIRPMGQFAVEQRTKDGMFNATALMKQWNRYVSENQDDTNTQKSGYLRKKDIDDFFANKGTSLFIEALLVEETLNGEREAFLKSRGKNGGTWMHPILFVKFAMWLNPRFEVQVIKFVYDHMIEYRNEASDAYKELCAAISKIVGRGFLRVAISNIAKAINWVVFNNHEAMIRNKEGVEDKMKELFSAEKTVAMLINDGFLSSYEGVVKYLRKKWSEKWAPKVLTSK